MTRDMNETRAAKARLSAVAGRLTLVGTGLGALALVAVSAQMLMETPANRTAVAALAAPRGPGAVTQALAAIDRNAAAREEAPQVWLASLTLPDTRFAADGYAHEAVLPRLQPGGTIARAVPATPPTVETGPAPRVSDIALTTPEPRMARADAHVEHPILARLAVPAPHAPTVVPQRRTEPQLTLRVPDVLTEPDATTEAERLALRAPRRSPMPPARPERAPAAEDMAPVIALSPEAAQEDAQRAMTTSLAEVGGLLRSRTPEPRPEAVTRLASLSLDTPAPIAAAPEASAPAAQVVPAALQIPALSGAGSDACSGRLTRAIPDRPRRAAEGSTVVSHLGNSGGSERDGAVIGEVLQGNIPEFLRNLVPVTFTGSVGGQQTRVTICVMPDYLAVGSNSDFVRVPLGLPAAMRVAERFDMVLPTTTMVDAIYQQAQVHLSPAPMDPTSAMSTTGYFMRHNTTVQGQLAQAGGRLGQLVSGHKKDLVLTNRLQSNPGRVAIYGWHQRNGRAIQPLSTVHGAQYADYSHGIRLVSRTAYVNGRAVDLRDLLSDSRTAGLVSAEGTITNRQLLALAN